MKSDSRGFAGLIALLIVAAIIGWLVYSGKVDTAYLKQAVESNNPIKAAQDARDKANSHESATQKALDEIH